MTTAAAGRRDDAGSMPIAMLITVVGVLLSGVLASSIAAQTDTTRLAVQRQHALDAAQSGPSSPTCARPAATRRPASPGR